MIKALAHDKDGKPVVFLGVDAHGVELLTNGMPIKVDFNEIDEGLFDCTTIIFYGKDHEALKDLMLGKNREVQIKDERHDMPLSVRAEFMKRVEALLEEVGDIKDQQDTSGYHFQSDNLKAAIQAAAESLELMKRTSP